MSYLNDQKNHSRQLLGLALATAMVTNLFAVTSYSATRLRFSGVAKTNGATSPLTQPQTSALKANGRIAFTSDRDGNREIYVMENDGTGQVRLTNNPGVDDSAAWSPDGRRIAYVSQNASGSFFIKLMNADGTGQTELTKLSFDQNCQQYCAVSLKLSWSPLGTRIAFAERVGVSQLDIFTINIDGSNRVNITNHPALDFQPAWSVDGSRIAFVSDRFVSSASYLTMHTMNANGSEVQALPSDGEFWDMSPDWSPNGDKIAFVANAEIAPHGVYTANADGTNRQIFDGGICNGLCEYRSEPKWSPDATKIAFNFGVAFSNDTEIYVKNVDRSGLTQLTNTYGRNFNPSWGTVPTAPAVCPNPIDCTDSFVRQHYLDFLNRTPDPAGLAFWINEIASCGADQSCIDAKRINVSAAFFI